MPLELRAEIPVSFTAARVIDWAREACAKVIAGKDDRLIVIVGPCSIHGKHERSQYLAPTLKSCLLISYKLIRFDICVCSIDPKQALDYARELKSVMPVFPDLVIIMRSVSGT